jgi:hypothetical protein
MSLMMFKRFIAAAIALAALTAIPFLGTTSLCYSWWHGTYCPALQGNPLLAGVALNGTQAFYAAPNTAYQVNQAFSYSFRITTSAIPNAAVLFDNSNITTSGWDLIGYYLSIYNFTSLSNFYILRQGLRLPATEATQWCGDNAPCVSITALTDGNPHDVSGSYNPTANTWSLSIDATVVDVQYGIYTPSTLPLQLGSIGLTATYQDVRLYCGYALTETDNQELFSYHQANLIPSSGPTTQNLCGHWQGPTTTIGGEVALADASPTDNPLVIDTIAPTASITSPTSGTVSGTVNVTGTYADNIAVASVQLAVNGVPLTGYASSTAPFTIPWNTAATVIDGSQTITVIATDRAGNSATSAGFTVTTSNGNPHHWAITLAGSDAAACTVAAPCLTLAKASTLSYGPGDTLSIGTTNGDTFSGCLLLTASNVVTNNPAAPFAVQAGGSGSPIISSNCPEVGGTSGAISIINTGNVVINGLTIRPGSIMTRGGVQVINTGSSNIGGIVIENNDIGGFGVYGASALPYGGEIFTDAESSGSITLQVLNNTLHGLSGATSTDDNGGTGFGNGSNNTNWLIQGDLVYDIGGSSGTGAAGGIGNGIIFNNTANGVQQYNLVHDVGANTATCGGPAGLWWGGTTTNPTTTFSEVYHVQHVGSFPGTYCDWDCYDADNGVYGAMFEYLYCHDSDGPAFLAFDSSNVTFRYSISENTNNGGKDAAMPITTSGTVNYYNNVVWISLAVTANLRPAAFEFDYGSNSSNTGVACNNIIANSINDLSQVLFVGQNQSSPTTAGPTGYLFCNNDYYNISGAGTNIWKPGTTAYTSLAAWQASVAGRDPNSITANPLLTAGGMGGNLTWTPSTQSSWPPSGGPTSDVPQGGSPLLGAGQDVTASPWNIATRGTRDYYANAVPQPSNCVNIGPYAASC